MVCEAGVFSPLGEHLTPSLSVEIEPFPSFCFTKPDWKCAHFSACESLPLPIAQVLINGWLTDHIFRKHK